MLIHAPHAAADLLRCPWRRPLLFSLLTFLSSPAPSLVLRSELVPALLLLLRLFQGNLISLRPSERDKHPDLLSWSPVPPVPLASSGLNWCICCDEDWRRSQKVAGREWFQHCSPVFLEVLISCVQVQIAASERLYLATNSFFNATAGSPVYSTSRHGWSIRLKAFFALFFFLSHFRFFGVEPFCEYIRFLLNCGSLLPPPPSKLG